MAHTSAALQESRPPLRRCLPRCSRHSPPTWPASIAPLLRATLGRSTACAPGTLRTLTGLPAFWMACLPYQSRRQLLRHDIGLRRACALPDTM